MNNSIKTALQVFNRIHEEAIKNGETNGIDFKLSNHTIFQVVKEKGIKHFKKVLNDFVEDETNMEAAETLAHMARKMSEKELLKQFGDIFNNEDTVIKH